MQGGIPREFYTPHRDHVVPDDATYGTALPAHSSEHYLDISPVNVFLHKDEVGPTDEEFDEIDAMIVEALAGGVGGRRRSPRLAP
jgi:hypothetical protein